MIRKDEIMERIEEIYLEIAKTTVQINGLYESLKLTKNSDVEKAYENVKETRKQLLILALKHGDFSIAKNSNITLEEAKELGYDELFSVIFAKIIYANGILESIKNNQDLKGRAINKEIYDNELIAIRELINLVPGKIVDIKEALNNNLTR